MIDQAPHTFNPRMAQDAYGQRLNALFFRGLTRINFALDVQPDLAESWSVSSDGLVWRFKIRQGLKDQAGKVITPVDLVSCLEQYRVGKPVSILAKQLDSWRSTGLEGQSTLVLRLNRPDPYLDKNISLLKFFRTSALAPCQEPDKDFSGMVGSGDYAPGSWLIRAIDDRILVKPTPARTGRSVVEVRVIRDDHRRILELLNGQVDAAQNSLPLGKSRWIQKNASDRFAFFEVPGVNVSYLAFNQRDPLLSRKEVRRAIALSIDRQSIVKHKLFGFCELSNSLVCPELPEGAKDLHFPFDPASAEKILDQAGYPRGKDGVRFSLSYRTTTQREGNETALLIQNDLNKIGIRLFLEVTEPAVFLAKINQGQFQLFSSRWIGVSDASILQRTLQSKNPFNRVGYVNFEMDQKLEKMISARDSKQRIALAVEIQKMMLDDLPYFPLWYWNNALILRRSLLSSRKGEFPVDKISRVGDIELIIRWLSGEGS